MQHQAKLAEKAHPPRATRAKPADHREALGEAVKTLAGHITAFSLGGIEAIRKQR